MTQVYDTRVESAWFQGLKLKCDALLSSIAFDIILRPYMKANLIELIGRGG